MMQRNFFSSRTRFFELLFTCWIVVLFLVGFGILYYFFSTDSSPVASSVSEKAVLKIGTSLSGLPWSDYDPSSGFPTGGEVEIAKIIAQKLGYQAEFVDVHPETLVQGLAHHRFDIALSALVIQGSAPDGVSMSAPYLETRLVLVTRETDGPIDTNALPGKTVGVKMFSSGETFVSTLQDVHVRRYQHQNALYQDLRDGILDVIVEDQYGASWQGKHQSDITVFPLDLTEEYVILLREQDKELLSLINNTLREIKRSPRFEQIRAKWY
ncbi:MAG TPA: ABC transporter substrate-binding protein [Patescibacteria group bacterium]|nr:ABC transporter substrate-binding protein [Patescibacteria group bacterium]